MCEKYLNKLIKHKKVMVTDPETKVHLLPKA